MRKYSNDKYKVLYIDCKLLDKFYKKGYKECEQ